MGQTRNLCKWQRELHLDKHLCALSMRRDVLCFLLKLLLGMLQVKVLSEERQTFLLKRFVFDFSAIRLSSLSLSLSL